MEREDDPASMEREVVLTIIVKAHRGDPLPEMTRTVTTARLTGEGEEGDEGEGRGGEGEGEESLPPPPPLEEMDVRFNLTLFNGETLQSEQMTFIKPPAEEGEEGAAAEGSAGEGEEGGEPKPPVLVRTLPFLHGVSSNIPCERLSSSVFTRSP